MFRSTNQELGEYDLIRCPDHIARVWGVIEAALPDYWEGFAEGVRGESPAAKLAAKFGKTVAPKTQTEAAVLVRVLEDAVTAYEKEARKYRQFFHPDVLDEFQDDPNAFKTALARDVPVIANTLRQRRAELQDWQRAFRIARPKDLLTIFCNVLDFVSDWSDAYATDRYEALDQPEAFGLDPLDEDENMSMFNVIGMGIKSIILYHLDPARLPARGRYGLYGLYFLSGNNHFDLPSRSSEFLMVNDISPASNGSIIMDHNYWYPYGLFSLYVLRVFRWIEERALERGLVLDRTVRYVYVERFFQSVCARHADDLKTMRAHERFEIPG